MGCLGDRYTILLGRAKIADVQEQKKSEGLGVSGKKHANKRKLLQDW